MNENVLQTQEIEKIIREIEESTRSTEEGVRRFVEPGAGMLSRATTRRHHIIFGRRGSGKSSLLLKAASDLTLDRRPIAYIDLEAFKGHSYPDVLISILIKTFKEYSEWLQTAAINPANKRSFWRKFFNDSSSPSRPAFNRNQSRQLSERLDQHVSKLEQLLYSEDNITVDQSFTSTIEQRRSGEVNATLSAPIAKTNSAASENRLTQTSHERHENFQQSKSDFLHRHIMEYQELFRLMSQLSGGDAFLFLDDLYHIRKNDQARVIDYFHRIAKNNNLWLKIGTIRHRTIWYIHGDPPIGLKMGDDADEIDLDLTLEKYASTKQFLKRILEGFLNDNSALSLNDILTDDAIDRLVLASGGVSRDFLNIFRRSVRFAQDRLQNNPAHHRGPKVGAEDVNNASGEYEATKREELKRDTLDDRTSLENEFKSIRDFCFDQSHANVFLTIKGAMDVWSYNLQELVDLRLVHKVNSRTSVRNRVGKTYEAYMLDTSQYTGSRMSRNISIIDFWRDNDSIRKAGLVYKD
jgi:hypothetical protein